MLEYHLTLEFKNNNAAGDLIASFEITKANVDLVYGRTELKDGEPLMVTRKTSVTWVELKNGDSS